MRSLYDPDRDSLLIDLAGEGAEAAVSTEICDVYFKNGAVALLLDEDGKLLAVNIMGVGQVLPSGVAERWRE
ncbi:hypothetical protein FrEUN1fDRAFT_4218 [Parafrankia sp. EUN1f]|nr:hypothetical protein FrEUN1fDRAFT_4218 [Parafrankia sp. EUN1f]